MQPNAEQYLEPALTDENVTAPDFDNERTLRSARRVVPLAKIGVKSRSWVWFSVAAAFLLIVLAIGILIQFRRGVTSPVAESVSSDRVVAPAHASEDSSGEIATDLLPDSSQSDLKQDNSTSGLAQSNSATLSSKKERPGVLNTREPDRKVGIASLKNKSDFQMPSELRREARRLKRVAEQTPKRNRVHSADGIFRIVDIFEGSRRP